MRSRIPEDRARRRRGHQGPPHGRLRRRCRGGASDPGRDHAVARCGGVLRADRGRRGMAAPEAGSTLAERCRSALPVTAMSWSNMRAAKSIGHGRRP